MTRGPGARRGLPAADVGFLRAAQRRLISGFGSLARGGTARMLDGRFGRFDLPRAAGGRQPSAASGVVLGYGTPVIRLSELAKYEAALGAARGHSGELRGMDSLLAECGGRMRRILARSGTAYRGMAIGELEYASRRGGAFGLNPRDRYAAENDFVSFSIDPNIAGLYAASKAGLGLIVEADVSGMDKGEHSIVRYEARNGIKVTRGGRHVYDPYEKFGGSHSGLALYECEVHLKAGSRPAITAVEVTEGKPASFKARMDRAISRLERIQGQKITIKYLPEHRLSWQKS